MKRFISIKAAFLTIFVLTILAISVGCTLPSALPTPTPSSSTSPSSSPTHTHVFDVSTPSAATLASNATCTDSARYYYQCICGEIGTETYASGEPNGHSPATDWTQTDTQHYHTCTAVGCGQHLDVGEHSFGMDKKCTICGYLTTELMGTEINSEVFEIDGTDLYARVPYAQTSIYFGDAVTVADDASFTVYADFQGTTPIGTYMGSLDTGDNVFYITVTCGGYLPRTYVVTIHRNEMLQVVFDTAGGTAVTEHTVEEGTVIDEPTTTRAGYDLSGWDYDFSVPITESITITASWTPRTDTAYVVEHYIENIADDDYSLMENGVERLTGTTGSQVYATIREIPHYTPLVELVSGIVDSEGALVLKVYYRCDRHVVFPADSKQGESSHSGEFKYGTQLTITAVPNCGYEFTGWVSNDEVVCVDTEYSLTVSGDIAPSFAVKEEMANFVFDSTQTTCTITGVVDATSIELTIPDYVTSVAAGALASCTSIQSLTTPFVGERDENGTNSNLGYMFGALTYEQNTESVPQTLRNVVVTKSKEIGNYAFYGCCFIESIQFPSNLTSIGERSLYGCRSLTEIDVPVTVKYFGERAFYGCTLLDTVNYAGTEYDWLYTDFAHEYSNPASYANNFYMDGVLIKDFVIPEAITAIGWYQFQTPAFDKIIVHNDVNYVGAAAFSFSTAEIIWGDKPAITEFKGFAFEYYLGDSISIPDGVTSLGAYTFAGTAAEIVWGENPTITAIGNWAFANYAGERIPIPDSVTILGDFVFSGSSAEIVWGDNPTIAQMNSSDIFNGYNGTSLTIPDSVTDIWVGLLEGCTSLESVSVPLMMDRSFGGHYYMSKVPETLKTIVVTSCNGLAEKAFYNLTSVTSVTLPDGLTEIPNNAFNGCTSLVSVNLPDSVERIGDYAFAYTAVDIVWGNNPSVTEIPFRAFYYHTGSRIEIPDSVEIIGEQAFLGCVGEIVWGDNPAVTTIGSAAFRRYGGARIVIPASVTSLGDSMFMDSATEVVWEENSQLTTIGYDVFYCYDGETLTIPDSVTKLSEYAFRFCYKLKTIVLPATIESIEQNAFLECTALRAVYYKGTSEQWTAMSKSSSNRYLYNATRYYYVENETNVPDDGGNYWHYENGVPTVWVKEQE